MAKKHVIMVGGGARELKVRNVALDALAARISRIIHQAFRSD